MNWWTRWKARRYVQPLIWLVMNFGHREGTLTHTEHKWLFDPFRVVLNLEDTRLVTGLIEYRKEAVWEFRQGQVFRYHPGVWEGLFWEVYHQQQDALFTPYEEKKKR